MIAFLVKDAATEIPCIAFRLDDVTEPLADLPLQEALSVAIIARAGFGRTRDHHRGYVILIRATGGVEAQCDPFAWTDLTMLCAHLRLLEDYDSVPAGGCIDVEGMRLARIDAMGGRQQVEAAVNVGHHDHDTPTGMAL